MLLALHTVECLFVPPFFLTSMNFWCPDLIDGQGWYTELHSNMVNSKSEKFSQFVLVATCFADDVNLFGRFSYCFIIMHSVLYNRTPVEITDKTYCSSCDVRSA